MIDLNKDIHEDNINYDSILDENRIDTSKPVDKPPTILSIQEIGTTAKIKRVFTLGNFSAIIGKMKSKKTFFLTLITSAIIKGKDYNDKFVGSLPENKKMVIYIDTEQSGYDSFNCIKRIEYMAGTKENFMGFNLRPFSPKERIDLIEFLFNKYKDKIALFIIDGIADLVTKINDEEEATTVTSMLLKYSLIYNCHIATVIHQNKQNDFATGHIGSSVMKKAEIIISVTKCKNIADSSDITCDYSRGYGFDPFIMSINDKGIPYVNSKKSNATPNFYDNDEDKTEDLF